MTFPRIIMQTYGTMASSRISGSRIPLFLTVRFIDIQSDSGPAVARPMKAPINIAKLKKPKEVRVNDRFRMQLFGLRTYR